MGQRNNRLACPMGRCRCSKRAMTAFTLWTQTRRAARWCCGTMTSCLSSTIKVPRSVLRAGSHVPLWALPSEACPVRYGSALAAALEKASGSCGSRRTAVARTTFTHAVINMMQRRWRSAYLSMPTDANQGNNRLLRNPPSVMPHPNPQWGTRGR